MPIGAAAGDLRIVEKAGHAKIGVGALGSAFNRRGQAREQGRPIGFQAVDGPGLDQGLPDASIRFAQIGGLQRMEEILEAAFGFARFENGLQRRFAEAFHRRETKTDLVVAGDGEIKARGIDVGTQHLDALFPAVLDVLHHVIGAAALGAEQACHELHGVVGLEESGFIGHQRVGRRVALVEAVASEVFDEVEDFRGLLRVKAPCHALGDELGFLLLHLA